MKSKPAELRTPQADSAQSQRPGSARPQEPEIKPAQVPHKPNSLSVLRNLPALLQLLRRRPAPNDKLPHARFSSTGYGIRSLVVAGVGSPTVIFESGIGQGKRNWAPVFNKIAELTQCVAYDRAGYGQSEASDQPRDGLQIVLELRDLLQTESIAPPYVLVGHSLGGTVVKLFAKTYPQEVAGVVLVDARHEEFTQRCRQEGVHRLLYQPPDSFLSMLPPVPRAEVLAAPLTLKQARRAGPFPEIPLIVLTQSNVTSRWPKSLGTVWEASQRKMAKMSTLGRIKVVGNAGHNVHMDRPDVVIRAVAGVVGAARMIKARKSQRRP